MVNWEEFEGFDWDDGNFIKNWQTHKVLHIECEQVFFHKPLLVYPDEAHSIPSESRYYALGQTDSGRKLFVVFTVRGKLIRVISARDMSRKEREIYAES